MENLFIKLNELGESRDIFVAKYEITAMIDRGEYTVIWLKGAPDIITVTDKPLDIMSKIEEEVEV